MTDIVEQARNYASNLGGDPKDYLVWQLADEVERLQDTIQFAEKVMAAKDAENERLRASRFEVTQLQPDADCPGLWIGFKTGKDRDEAMKLFALKDTKP